MPYSAPSLCTEPGCGRLVHGGRCDEHTLQARRAAEARRPKGHGSSYNRQWRQAAKDYLRHHRECEGERCMRRPWYARPAATQVDHIDGLGPSGPRGFDESNMQALCQSCHSAKTASRDGGFGNPKRNAEPAS